MNPPKSVWLATADGKVITSGRSNGVYSTRGAAKVAITKHRKDLRRSHEERSYWAEIRGWEPPPELAYPEYEVLCGTIEWRVDE